MSLIEDVQRARIVQVDCEDDEGVPKLRSLVASARPYRRQLQDLSNAHGG